MDDNRTPVIVDLPEGLLLLATDDETGRIASKSGALDLGLAGAVLTELFLEARLVIEGGKVRGTDTTSTDDPILDDALAKIADSRPRDAKHWVKKLSGDHVKDRVLDRLTQKGVLRREEHRILWIIPADRYPAEDDSPERDVREAVGAAVAEGAPPQPRTAALIGLLKACDLTDVLFSRDERKRYKGRINEIANSDLMGEAVSKAVKDGQAATAAMIASTAAVSASTASSG